MRQVNRDELIGSLRFALQQLPPAIMRDLSASRSELRERGRALAAGRLADALKRYEILSSTVLDHPAGDALFSPAANYGLPGAEQTSGVAPIDEPS